MSIGRNGWRQARLETILDLSLALAGPRRETEVIEELVQRAVGLLDARSGVAFSLLPDLSPGATSAVGWELDRSGLARIVASPLLGRVREGEVGRLAGGELEQPFQELLIAPCLWRSSDRSCRGRLREARRAPVRRRRPDLPAFGCAARRPGDRLPVASSTRRTPASVLEEETARCAPGAEQAVRSASRRHFAASSVGQRWR
jgi:hypothetical protein